MNLGAGVRIDGKRFIDYNDYHLPLHHSDILTMEAMRLAPGKITRNYVGGEGMDTVFKEDVVECLLTQGEGGDMLNAVHIRSDFLSSRRMARA
jgi:hypothetical protein